MTGIVQGHFHLPKRTSFTSALRPGEIVVDLFAGGAGTSRTRLFLLARRDGQPIRWPEPTHGPGRAAPFVTAADCIDFSQACPSIFTRKRPLADATLRRIARGVKRFVIDAAEPFIVHATHHGERPGHGASDVLPTITAANRGELMASRPTLAPILTEHANASRSASWSASEPLRTACAGVKGGHFALASATLAKFRGDSAGVPVSDPLPTITSGAGAERVAAFLVKYYGTATGVDLRDPLAVITTRDRLALVTVQVCGVPYVIVDIGLRMLKPRELYTAQGFPLSYIIDRTASGKLLTISQRVRMVGNSVSPPPLCALARANIYPATLPDWAGNASPLPPQAFCA